MRFVIHTFLFYAAFSSVAFAQKAEILDNELFAPLRAAKFSVPEGDTEEVSAYLTDLSNLRSRLTDEYDNVMRRIFETQAKAAKQLFDDADKLPDDVFLMAARLELPKRVSAIANMDELEKSEVITQMKRQLSVAGKDELMVSDVSIAYRLVTYLERSNSLDLALSATRSFRPIIEEAGAERHRSAVESLKKIETRLAVLGSKLELSGELADGSDFDWSKYRGKIVLVDFWATWCGPCVAEIPNLKKQLAFYGDRGFDIVSISLDSDRAKLAEFLKDNKIEWANLHEEELGRSHPIAKKYSIRAIPTAWLVDREGKVINLNVRGHRLGLELARMIGPRSGEAGELAVNGRWAEASEAMKRFVAKHESAKHVKGLVVAQILAGDLEGYRATCKSLWQQIDQRGPYDQANIVIYCSLLPDSGVAPENLMEVADALLGKMWNNNFSVALAMASYRAGDYERCDARLKSDASPLQQFEDACFTSMAAHRLGRRGQAARQLATAKELFAEHFSSIDGYRTGRYNSDHWMNCALAQIVLNEAQSLVHAHPTNLPSKETPTVAPRTEAPVDAAPRALKD